MTEKKKNTFYGLDSGPAIIFFHKWAFRIGWHWGLAFGLIAFIAELTRIKQPYVGGDCIFELLRLGIIFGAWFFIPKSTHYLYKPLYKGNNPNYPYDIHQLPKLIIWLCKLYGWMMGFILFNSICFIFLRALSILWTMVIG